MSDLSKHSSLTLVKPIVYTQRKKCLQHEPCSPGHSKIWPILDFAGQQANNARAQNTIDWFSELYGYIWEYDWIDVTDTHHFLIIHRP